MKMLLIVGVTTVASLLLGGCATGFYASAPAAQAGSEYVVGHQGSQRTVWLCPVGAASAECRRVTVQD
jgi:hypothetical protein